MNVRCSQGLLHNAEGYIPKPESLVVPSLPPAVARTAEDQPCVYVPRNSDDPRIRIDISPGLVSLSAHKLIEEEALSRENAAAASNALSLAEYVYNYPGMPKRAQIVLHQLNLDLVACCNFSWREPHNKMLLCHLIALENLKIDEDQKLVLLHAPFTGTSLFFKLQESNIKANAITVFPPKAPLSPIPPDCMSVKAEVLTIQIGEEVILEGAVARPQDRAHPRQTPLILSGV